MDEKRGCEEGTYKTQMTVLLDIDAEVPLATVPFCLSCWVAMSVRFVENSLLALSGVYEEKKE